MASTGFTLLELLVVMAIMMLAVLIGYPMLLKTVARSNLESTAQLIAALLRQARLESVKRAAPAVIVLDPTTKKLSAFLDLNDNAGTPNSDLLFNPKAGLAADNTDYLIGELQVPARVDLGGPASDPLAVKGLTDRGAGPRLVFNGDGSVVDTGAFRVKDNNENDLEIAIEPKATGRVQLRKWSVADSVWYTRDMKNGKALWEWYG
ncbi:MAG TPA: GspH/FimT family pseudopilin [Thermoanaerobaculia bacterium]|nr:GspH/FimT family pseudopilin [Thermoanaerobaculia bacterium]